MAVAQVDIEGWSGRPCLQEGQVCAGLVAGLPAGQPVRRAQQRVAEQVDLQAARAAAACAARGATAAVPAPPRQEQASRLCSPVLSLPEDGDACSCP